MNFKYVDFEKVTSHYSEYRKGVDEINQQKSDFLKEIEPIRKEMNSIISSSSMGLIVDNRTQQQKAERFQQLQAELMQKDSEFKQVLKKMSDDLNVKSFDFLSEVIGNWAKENDVDVVSSKMETIFVSEKYDSTNEILDLLKSNQQFVELPEVEEVKN
jgi:Skp family chaperone for outer membrane proteins